MEHKMFLRPKWKTDTDITWWNDSRRELNKIIEVYNTWQISDAFDKHKAIIVLAWIEYGQKTIGAQDGGSGYMDELQKMEDFVRKVLDK